jgi:hypothetical protein
LASEEREATDAVFTGDIELTNHHFKMVGLALGLVRIKALHYAKQEELAQSIKGQPLTINTEEFFRD